MNALSRIDNNSDFPASNQQLEDKITQLAANINAANYQFLIHVAEYDRRGLWADWGMSSCADWLNWKCGIGHSAAREKLRVANALGDLPKISTAFASGQLSYSKVRAMSRIANSNNEDLLLMVAEHGSASHIEKTVRGYQRVSREQSRQQQENRRLDYFWDNKGNLIVKATLPAEQGALFLKGLEALVERLDEDDRKSEMPDTSAETETKVKNKFWQPAIKRANRRADAAVLMAENQLEHMGAALKTADRYQVVIHSDVSQALIKLAVENGPALSEETVKRICCDASVRHIVSDKGEPVSIGRKSRTVPAPMRTALQFRDGGCQFPGCCRRHVDAHHLKHWSDGGETSLDNLVLLCRHHHKLVHEGGYRVCRTSNGFEFFRPDGSLIPGVPEPNKANELDRSGNGIWSWNGDRMDYNIAIEGLFFRESKRLDNPSAEGG